MPAPTWDWAPQRQNGNYEPGFDRRRPSEQVGWTPPLAPPFVTEPGGGMFAPPGHTRAKIDDFFSYPQGQDAQVYYDQQIQSGAMPAPGPVIQPEFMDESQMYKTAGPSIHAGSMPWEGGPAPWEQPGGPQALPPSKVSQAIAANNAKQLAASEVKAGEAVKAAKIAADNAVRAAVAGAPKVAATNAATAQAAANVASGVAKTIKGQQAAALAQSEATKAIAAANVAAANANGKANGNGNGMNDWIELSGMSGVGHMLDKPVFMGLQVKHLLLGALVGAAVYYKPWKKWGKR